MAEDRKSGPAWTITSSVNTKGEFVRVTSSFRNWIKADPQSEFPAEKNRYHLYVSLACPWAHRTLIVRKLKGLEDVISVNVVHYHMTGDGWHFDEKETSSTVDEINGFEFLRQVYRKVEPGFEGRITVPVLFDKIKGTIVSNESSEIIRMLNSEFNQFSATPQQAALDLYPQNLRNVIEETNTWVYDGINNGVYKSGFATTQSAYENAVQLVFDSLDRLESILAEKRYLTGSQLTEADVRLYTTLVRFDAVYVGHFKCNLRRIVDYPNIWNYLKELYQIEAFGSTTNFKHIKGHYYVSHVTINPTQVVPKGPIIDFEQNHDRDRL